MDRSTKATLGNLQYLKYLKRLQMNEHFSTSIKEDEELLLEQKITEVLLEKRIVQEDEVLEAFEEYMKAYGSTTRRVDNQAQKYGN